MCGVQTLSTKQRVCGKRMFPLAKKLRRFQPNLKFRDGLPKIGEIIHHAGTRRGTSRLIRKVKFMRNYSFKTLVSTASLCGFKQCILHEKDLEYCTCRTILQYVFLLFYVLAELIFEEIVRVRSTSNRMLGRVQSVF